MKSYKILLTFLFALLLISCDRSDEGETVETANILWPLDDFVYKFQRNAMSSVDYYEVDLLTEPLQRLKRKMQLGQTNTDYYYKDFMRIYHEGMSYVKPEEQVASSPLCKSDSIKNDLLKLIEASRKIKKETASEGVAGYVGGKVGFAEKIYVNAKGLAYAEVFSNMIDGAIYLDKIFNFHLDERLLNSEEIRADHENLVLVTGKNYTELEHHWDLGYGYFTKIQILTQANGVYELKGIERKILDAFVWGRNRLGVFRYPELLQQLGIVREQLSKAIAIQTIQKLVGKITEVNYKENPKQAFKYLSQAYGMIYNLQFTRKADGSYFFTYQEVKALQQQLMGEKGLWNKERLLADEQVKGSLKNIAKQIKMKYNL